MSRTSILLLLTLGILSLSITGCDENKVFEDYKDFETSVWHVDTIPGFSFTIADTQVPYQIDYNIRYAISYPYQNLYLTYYVEDSTGKVIDSNLQEVYLFESKTGEPKGSGLGDIFDYSVLGLENYKFPAPGTYKISLKQFMRQEELPFILSMGITVKKIPHEPAN